MKVLYNYFQRFESLFIFNKLYFSQLIFIYTIFFNYYYYNSRIRENILMFGVVDKLKKILKMLYVLSKIPCI